MLFITVDGGIAVKVYLNPITIGIMVSFLIIYLAFIPTLVHQYRNYGSIKLRSNIVMASFIVYMITAWFMTILPLPSVEEVRAMQPVQPNFRPFLFVDTFLKSSGFYISRPGTWLSAMGSSSFFTVAFNIVLTIPFGVYLRKYFRRSLIWVAVLGLFLSLFYEMTQYTGLFGIYPKAYRFADVDDLIINTLGAVTGYFLTGCIDRLLPNPDKDMAKITEKAGFVRRALFLLVDSVAVNLLFELSRVGIYWNVQHREWDTAIFLAAEAVVFLLLPLITRRRQTAGMFFLNLKLINKEGKAAKTLNAMLHNCFAGLWLHTVFTITGMVKGYSLLYIVFQLLFFIWLVSFLMRSLLQKRLCYFWEPWFNAYLKSFTKNSSLKSRVPETESFE